MVQSIPNSSLDLIMKSKLFFQGYFFIVYDYNLEEKDCSFSFIQSHEICPYHNKKNLTTE
jgi:hypothetical protein